MCQAVWPVQVPAPNFVAHLIRKRLEFLFCWLIIKLIWDWSIGFQTGNLHSHRLMLNRFDMNAAIAPNYWIENHNKGDVDLNFSIRILIHTRSKILELSCNSRPAYEVETQGKVRLSPFAPSFFIFHIFHGFPQVDWINRKEKTENACLQRLQSEIRK